MKYTHQTAPTQFLEANGTTTPASPAAPARSRRRSSRWAPTRVAFTRALGLNKADVLGFSIGGMVAQEIALQAPDLVRKLILVGTGPRGGQGMESLTQAAGRLF